MAINNIRGDHKLFVFGSVDYKHYWIFPVTYLPIKQFPTASKLQNLPQNDNFLHLRVNCHHLALRF